MIIFDLETKNCYTNSIYKKGYEVTCIMPVG